MNIKWLYVYQYPDGGEGGGGGGGQPAGGTGAPAVAPADARAFVSAFVPDPKILEGLDDTRVVEYHSQVTAALDKVRPAGGKWPENWRQELAGGDEKALKQLERYLDPPQVWKKARELEGRLSSGELRSVLPKDATPEQVNAWRAENGIPPSPDKYELKLKDGLVIGEQDKPIVDAILAKIHAKNVTNEQASELVNAYYETIEQETKRAAEAEAKMKQDTADLLNKKWGADYRANMNGIANLIAANVAAGSDLQAKINNTVATNAEFAELMASLARQINPASTLLPGSGAAIASALEDEIAAIEKDMNPASPGYQAYIKDEAKQARYRALITARDAAKARG